MQEQTGPLARLRHLAQNAGDRHLRRIRNPAAGRLAPATPGGALHRVLQVPLLQRQHQTRQRRRASRREQLNRANCLHTLVPSYSGNVLCVLGILRLARGLDSFVICLLRDFSNGLANLRCTKT